MHSTLRDSLRKNQIKMQKPSAVELVIMMKFKWVGELGNEITGKKEGQGKQNIIEENEEQR